MDTPLDLVIFARKSLQLQQGTSNAQRLDHARKLLYSIVGDDVFDGWHSLVLFAVCIMHWTVARRSF